MTVGDKLVKKVFLGDSEVSMFLGEQRLYPTNLDAPVLDLIDGNARATTYDLRTEKVVFYMDGVSQLAVLDVG